MTRYWAVVEQNTVTNVVMWDGVSTWSPPDGAQMVEVVDGGPQIGISWTLDGETWTPPAMSENPPPVPPSITRRQCAIELRERGMITAQEALDMTKTGTPPAMIAAMFAQMPGDMGIIAETDFAAAQYLRGNPLLNQMMEQTGASQSDIDDFFRAAAQR